MKQNNKFTNLTVHLWHIPVRHLEQKCTHTCSELCLVGYGTGALWDLWDWSIESLLQLGPGGWFNINMSSYQYRISHCGDKTVVRSSYVHNGNSYTGKTTSLYWIRAPWVLIVVLHPISLYSLRSTIGVQLLPSLTPFEHDELHLSYI